MSKEACKWHSRQVIPNGPMKSVLGALAYLHCEGKLIFPSQAYLARETGLTDRSVRTALALLEAMGVVDRRHRSAGAKGRISDSYTLRLNQEFMFTRRQIRDTRNALRYRKHIPVGENSLPERGSFATGSTFRGIGDEQDKSTFQEEAIQGVDSSVGHMREAGVVVPLRVVGGGVK